MLRPDSAGAAAAKYVCSIASAIAERDADLVAGAACWQALPLAQLILQCVSRPEREVRGQRKWGRHRHQTHAGLLGWFGLDTKKEQP